MVILRARLLTQILLLRSLGLESSAHDLRIVDGEATSNREIHRETECSVAQSAKKTDEQTTHGRFMMI